MQISTVTYPAELMVRFPRRFSRKERMAAETLKESYHNLLKEAERIHTRMQTAENHFNYLAEEKEIDACIYRLRTAQCQYASAMAGLKNLQERMENLLGETPKEPLSSP